MAAVADQIEPAARDFIGDAPDEMVAQASMAISLKRIADAMTGVGGNFLTAPINSYGEAIGDAIQGQMIRGQRGIDQYEGK